MIKKTHCCRRPTLNFKLTNFKLKTPPPHQPTNNAQTESNS